MTFLGVLDKAVLWMYCGFWLFVAIYAVSTAVNASDPKYLGLAATASLNILIFRLTGKTRGELKKDLTKVIRPKLPYLFCGVIATGGVWLSLHFDDLDILIATLIVVSIGLMFSWVFS